MPDFDDDVHWLSEIYDFPNSIHRIEIGEGITSIGASAFHGDSKKNSIAKSVSLKLPSTLKEIGDFSFMELNISELIIPESVTEIGMGSFMWSRFSRQTLVIPKNVKICWICAFDNCNIKELIVEGDLKIHGGCFSNNHALEKVVIKGSLAKFSDKQDSFFGGCSDFMVIADKPESYKYLFNEAENVRFAAFNDDNVSGFIANRLAPWNEFIDSKTKDLDIPNATSVKRVIENNIARWQKKDEFETTAQWQKRVNDRTRQARIDSLTTIYKTRIARAQKNYSARVESLKAEYSKLRQKYANEFYSGLAKDLKKEYKNDPPRLDNPYDADNETYLLNTDNHGDVLLRVPRAEARAFKQNWQQIRNNITYEFAPADEKSVALTKMVFSNAGKKYVYDGKTDAAYAIAEVDYNFAPLEIGNLNFDAMSLPELAEETTAPVRTIGVEGIGNRKVEVERNKLTAGNGTVPGRSDVDVNVPKGNRKRPDTFALVIANENYRRVAKVPYALNDGSMVSRYMRETLGIPEKNIIHVSDASLNDINYNLERLRDICEAYRGDASVIVYYAGHGVPDEASRDAYLLPADGYAEAAARSGLSLAGLTSALEAMPTKQSILFLDACFSGAGRQGDMLSSVRGVKLKPKENAVKGNLVVFSASQGDETAQPYAEQKHGLFTYYLLKKLGESAGEITLGQLAEYITDQVQRTSAVNGSRQTPAVTTAPGNDQWHSRKL